MKKVSTTQHSISNTFDNLQSKIPTVAGVSLVEIAVLGAAGYVVWKNRDKISNLLEENGMSSPAFLTADFSDLLRSGASAIGVGAATSFAKSSSTSTRGSRRQDA
jgi:hypothetical protein